MDLPSSGKLATETVTSYAIISDVMKLPLESWYTRAHERCHQDLVGV